MTCENLNPFDPTLSTLLAQTALDGIVGAIAGQPRLKKIDRAYVGIGPVPAEDCCPDIVVWVSNIRLWDGAAPDTLIEGRVLTHWGIAFDINARVGDCFWELDPKTNVPYPANKITEMAGPINAYGTAAYLGAITALGQYDACNVDVHPQPANPYQDGGCAGFLFTIGVSVI
jgi:hypothetical protein